jgi:alpha-L-arabinofuranosidase
VDDITLVAAGGGVAPLDLAQLSVNANLAVRTADPRGFGVNEAIWDSSLGAPEAVSLLQEIGCQFLRYPGGAQSDDYHWNANQTDTTTFGILLAGLGAQAVLTVNYGSGTPQEARSA